MHATDASVCPYPAGNSSAGRMAIEASELGFDSIVVIDGEPACSDTLCILRGMVIRASSVKDLLKQAQRAGPEIDLIFVDAGDLAFNRAAVTARGVSVLRSIYRSPKNAFDHVAARAAAERGVAVDINLYPIVHYRGAGRQKVLHRYADLLLLHRRYGFGLTISSNARSILDQRSVRETERLCALFGMTHEEVAAALATVGTLLRPARPVRVIA
ncbi:ribonuclease P [Methanoculleus sp. FWC-SCC1]|uniref:Ribonuclease P protein component 3 n=1 Tax=Methanoculleus frigidifontis TaxID=2584085 RepID=A0ABT8M7T9_9EURY|nr:RNase P subunit p30 family protein [Methanoculleus sp. FWC-SCC1]MDN7023988.1 ribonuclease P [Methanoculleus sp. FWC-SCC1]